MSDGFELSLEGMKAYCDRNEVKFLVNEELQQLGIPTALGKGFLLRVIPRPSRHMLTFALPLPLRVPPGLHGEVSRAVALCNSSMFMGAWVLNQGKGELYYRVTVPTAGVSYDDASVQFLLSVMVTTVRSTADALGKIVMEGAPASLVLQKPKPVADA